MLACGAAALLYLVVKELLVEAHEEEATPLLGSMFFLGFLGLYVLALGVRRLLAGTARYLSCLDRGLGLDPVWFR